MKRRQILSLSLAFACALTMLTGCGSKETQTASNEHETITMEVQFRNATKFLELVKEKYPEINLEIIPYSGQNKTAYCLSELAAGDMPDIYTATVYTPGLEDLSDRLVDLSGYDFTNNYSESRLRDVTDNGAIYLLPAYYDCLGITYNKTLLEQNGWELPTSFAELEELAPKVKEAGYNLSICQVALPGYGFQYLCNILDTDFLNTIDGRTWQKNYLNGTASAKDTPEFVESFSTLQKWKDIGMLEPGDLKDDTETKKIMAEGNTLFMLGSSYGSDEQESDCEFGLMPYLSEDGTQNSLVLSVSRYYGLNKHLEDKGNEQKLEDAVHVMEVLSTVEGLTSLNEPYMDSTLLPLKDYEIPDTNKYKENEDNLNKGLTAPFIYNGWENLIVPIGNEVIEYINDNATKDDIVNVLENDHSLVTDNSSQIYTTVTEKLDTDDCARLIGICFGKAAGADLSLISKNKWYPVYGDEIFDLNSEGVSGNLFTLPVTDDQITSILPTGWRGNIQTVTLTGKRIKELAEKGYNAKEDYWFPYELVTPEGMTIDDSETYTVAICGVANDVAEEGKLTDTGILGLTVAEEYFGQFETLSKKDLVWEK